MIGKTNRVRILPIYVSYSKNYENFILYSWNQNQIKQYLASSHSTMQTNNMAIHVYSHTSVERGVIKENRPATILLGLLYKMATPVQIRSEISSNSKKWKNSKVYRAFEMKLKNR